MNYLIRYKKYIISTFIFILSLLIIIVTYYFNKPEIVNAEPNIEKIETVEEVNEEVKIKVEIKGAVNNPGVYEISENSRVIDIINLSGGLIETADTSLINLSKKLEDEMVIIIYTKDEIINYNNNNVKTEYVYIEVNNCPDPINDACIKEYTEETEDNEQSISNENNVININTASIEELTTLSGIGESKAKLIIEYRTQNGKFKNIEELSNVKGIGESLIEKIKDNITV